MEPSTCNIGGIEPMLLSIPYRGNQVSAQGIGTAYGIGFTLSDNNQFFSVMPGFQANNTYVVNVDQCDTERDFACVSESGGVYTPPDGVNVTSIPASWNGTRGRDIGTSDVDQEKLYNDKLILEGHTIFGFPFYTFENPYDGFSQPAALALGSNSSFLQAALEVQAIGTKAWSFWPGSRNLYLDGHLILGGYDADRLDGEFTTYEVVERYTAGDWPVSMYVDIEGLEWEYSVSNTTNLMPNDTTKIGAFLDPYYDYIGMPTESMAILTSAYNATYNYTSSAYMFESYPTGNLVITLANGSKTYIPAADLFDLPFTYDADGIQDFYYPDDGYSYKAKMWSSDYGTNGFLLPLGLPFLSQKLVVADYDNRRFHIGDAAKHDRVPNVQRLCVDPPPPGPSNNTTPDPGPQTNVAAIAGGVGGGVGGLLVIALIAFFVLRRRKQKKRAAAQQVPHLAEVTQIHGDVPYRGSAMSPPPKYMTTGVYEAGSEPQRYQSPQPRQSHFSSELASPRFDQESTSQFGRSDHRMSQAGVSTTGNDSKHEMSSENRFTATSGPFEMPNEYDYDDRVDRRP